MRRWLLAVVLGCAAPTACARFYAEDPSADAGSDAAVDAGGSDRVAPADGPTAETSDDGGGPLRGSPLCGSGETALVFDPTTETFASAGFTVVPASATSVTALSDEDADAATWVGRSGTGVGTLRFAHKTFLAPAGSKITRVSVRARARRADGANIPPASGLALGLFSKKRNEANVGALQPHQPTYARQDHSLVTEPFENRPWALADIADLELEARLDANGGSAVELTRLWLEICLGR